MLNEKSVMSSAEASSIGPSTVKEPLMPAEVGLLQVPTVQGGAKGVTTVGPLGAT
jgi:hypothetical protein